MRIVATVVVLACLVILGAVPAWSGTAKPLSVNVVAAQPGKYLGKLEVVGKVSAVSPGKGFTLVDSGDCKNCSGSQCGIPKKIPLFWRGAAPAVKAVVVVKGVLSKSAGGMTFVAENVKPSR